MTFEERARALRLGDPDAIAWMFATFRGDVARCFLRRSPEDQADLVQDVFAIALRRLPTFRGEREVSLRAWLRSIAFHQWHHRWEAERVRARHAGPGLEVLMELCPNHPALAAATPGPDDTVAARDLIDSLLARLTPGQAWVVRAHLIEGHTTTEIAETAGVDRERVRGLYKRAIAKLRTDHRARYLLEAA